MSAKLFSLPRQVILTNAGALIPGAQAYFYINGTTTQQTVYTDSALTTPHTQPVVADGSGRFPAIYLDGTLRYKVTIDDASDVEIYTEDDFQSLTNASDSLLLGSTAPFVRYTESGAGAQNGVWETRVDAEQFEIRLGNDALDTYQNAAVITRTANTVDSIDLTATALTLNTDTVHRTQTGSFTSTVTGGTGGSVITYNYTIRGKVVTLSNTVADIVTSTTNLLTLPSLPSAIQPTLPVYLPTVLLDNGATNFNTGMAFINNDASGVITFSIGDPLVTNGFTSSGVKGLPSGWQLVYLLS